VAVAAVLVAAAAREVAAAGVVATRCPAAPA